MALPLEQIDTSLIEELMGLKRDAEALRGRLALMAAEVDKVSAPVFQRVHADYQARLQTLDERAAPKKDQARREHAKLRLLLDEVGARRDAVLLDQEELELRHRLGEFEEADFRARSGELAQRITELDRELAAVIAVRGRFVAAFDSETELAQAPAPAAAGAPAAEVLSAIEPTESVEPAAAPVAGLASTKTRSRPRAASVDVAAEAQTPPERSSRDGLGLTAAPLAGEASPAAPMSFGTVFLTDLAKPADAAPAHGPTMIVSFGRLMSLEEGAGAMEFRVQPLTTIGRTRNNDVQVDAPSVSRKHAQIELTENGYVVRDLGSENGTFVNGERIAEHRLTDGDLLHFGGVGFSFHTS
jgi:FHA domain